MSIDSPVGQEIMAVIAVWKDAVRRKDAAAIAGLYTADGALMVANAPIGVGAAAIAAMWAGMLALPGVAIDFGPNLIEAAASGEMAYDVGAYTLGFDGPAGRIEDKGKYVVVWRKVDGAWRAAVDSLTSDGAAQ